MTDETSSDAAGTRRELLKVLHQIDPEAPPTFRGRTLDRNGLLEVARAALAGDAAAQEAVNEIFERRLIAERVIDAGRHGVTGLDEEWRANMELVPELRAKIGPMADSLMSEEATSRVCSEVLIALLDPLARSELEAEAGEVIRRAAEMDPNLSQTAALLQSDGSEPVRLVATKASLAPEVERLERQAGERRKAEAAYAAERSRQADSDRARRRRRVRRRDLAILGAAALLVVSVFPATLLGYVLSSGGPLRDGGSVLLRDLGDGPQIVSFEYWATGAILIFALAALGLCVRTQIRGHPWAVAAILASALTALALLIALPGIRDSAWASSLGVIGKAGNRGPCTHSEGAAYVLSAKARQPVLVGPAPHCQIVTRLSRKRGHFIWQRWVPGVRISRIHRFSSTLVVGGTFGGSLVGESQIGGRLVVVRLATLTGREIWRHSCTSPTIGDRGISFGVASSGSARIAYVRIDCALGKPTFFDPMSGRTVRR